MVRWRLLILLTPLVLWGLLFLVHALRGKRITRAHVTVGLSVLTLLYFLVVVGTGLFWVAAQELPVFDWHYLPGYLLLLLTLAHVAFHWRTILGFLRRQSPAALVVPDRSRFRRSLGVLGWALLGMAGAGAFFMLGMRKGTQRIQVEGGAKGATLTTLPGALVKPVEVQAGGEVMALARFYHEGSSYPSRAALPALTVKSRPEVYRNLPGKPVALPGPGEDNGPSVLQAAGQWREGRKGPAPTRMALADLGRILWAAQGVTETFKGRTLTFDLRTSPSAGALYPANVYVAALGVEGLEPGLYYHHPLKQCLVPVKEGVMAAYQVLMAAGLTGLESPATLVCTTTFARTAFKYGERAYRYVAMDTGHTAYNASLAAAGMGWSAPMVVRFDDRALNSALGVSGEDEAGLLVMPLTTKPLPGSREFLREATALRSGSFVDLIHGATAFRLGGSSATLPLPKRRFTPQEGDVALPTPAEGKPLFPTLKGRRSVRKYSAKSMELAELAALCVAAQAPSTTDPLLSQTAPLGLYAVVRDVAGLEPGVYRYLPETRALQKVRGGDFSEACMKACLRQDFCGTADVVFVKTVRWSDLLVPDGDRGYRYANLLAGVMGEGLYLQGTALGLGVCGVGAFEDPSVASILAIDLKEEVPLYVTAVGK